MKAPVVFGSFLALAGTAITSERADAAVLSADVVNSDLKTAICNQDWYQAIELSSRLIVSPKVSPEYREKLLTWRTHFYTSAQNSKAAEELPSCNQLQASSSGEIQRYAGPTPRFSSAGSSVASQEQCVPGTDESCISVVNQPQREEFIRTPSASNFNNNLWTVGVRVEGNRLRGKLLNNGWNTFRNVRLIIRSRELGHSTDIKTVALDTVRAWSETEFVAAFAESPGDWIIERIEVN